MSMDHSDQPQPQTEKDKKEMDRKLSILDTGDINESQKFQAMIEQLKKEEEERKEDQLLVDVDGKSASSDSDLLSIGSPRLL